MIDKRPIQGEVAVHLDASCNRNRNKPNSVTMHVGLMLHVRLSLFSRGRARGRVTPLFGLNRDVFASRTEAFQRA